MNSHTVPRKLLDQFAYDDPVTKSRLLWQYKKGRTPYGKASPTTATRIHGHFADPRDKAKEHELETRLNVEFEQPVNRYLEELSYRTFVLNITHTRQLTAYVTLLFNRSKARRNATSQQVDITVQSIRTLLADDDKLSQIAAKWTMEMVANDLPFERMITVDDVKGSLEERLADHLSADQLQHSYCGTMERAMEMLDEGILNGQWDILRSTPEDPFVIGDAPVVTWERDERNFLIHGQGFNRPDVEVFLPVSPLTCLHILPKVERTRRVITPTVEEVNIAQASFASDSCFTNVRSELIDAALQPRFGLAKIGVTAFSIRHRDYSNTMFELIMNGGNWVDPSKWCWWSN